MDPAALRQAGRDQLKPYPTVQLRATAVHAVTGWTATTAGGIGITPFMSWIRSLDSSFDRSVDFYYSVRRQADALHFDDIDTAAHQHPTFRPTLVETGRESLLTAEKAANGHPGGTDVWVYMCGPPPMMRALANGFLALGIPAGRVRWEQFDIR
jgi:predicted ferric reductase